MNQIPENSKKNREKFHASRAKLKVSILSPHPSSGGMTRAIFLAALMHKAGYEVEIVHCIFREGESIYPKPPGYIKTVAVRHTSYLRLARKIMEVMDGDLIYCLKPKPDSLGIALLHRLRKGRPVILDIDDWELSFLGEEENQATSFLQWQAWRFLAYRLLRLRNLMIPRLKLQLMEFLVKKADAVTVSSRFLQRRFGGTYLPSGKDTSLFDPAKHSPQVMRERYGLSRFRVLMFPGTSFFHKGLEDVLHALDILKQEDIRLVVVGGKKSGDKVVNQLQEKWERWIIRMPRIPLEKIPEIIAAAHVVVVPQRDNATARAQCPMKLTDGMAMGKPVLSTCVGDIPDLLGDTGYLVPPSSPKEIAKTLKAIFQNGEQAEQMGKRARKRCVEHFSLDALGKNLSSVLARCPRQPSRLETDLSD